jgi:WD40 repeat protein
MDGTVRVWVVASGKCETKVKRAHGPRAVNCVALSEDRVLSGGDDNCARLFGARSGLLLAELRGHVGPVSAVCFLERGGPEARVATASADGFVRLWLERSGAALASVALDAPVTGLAWLAGTSRLALCSGSALELVDVGAPGAASSSLARSGRLLSAGGGAALVGCAVRAKGGLLYAAAASGRVYFRDPAAAAAAVAPSSGEPPGECAFFESGSLELVGLCLHPTEPVLAVQSRDGLVRTFRAPAEQD